MTDFGLSFHHIGLAVKKPEDAINFVQGLGYEIGTPVFDVLQNVNLIMCSHPTDPKIEIIYPGNEKSPIDAFVTKYSNGIVYHCCYVTKNIEDTLSEFTRSGLRPHCISQPTPAILFDGAKVSFYQVLGIGLIEIIEDRF